MPLTILNAPCGLTFEDWQDVYHEVPEGSEIGSHTRDMLDSERDCYYLDLEAMTRGLLMNPAGAITMFPDSAVHKDIALARGIGNWRSAKIVLLVKTVDAPGRLGDGSPLWELIPAYKRLRPFSFGRKGRTFLWRLMGHSGLKVDDIYITSVLKPWCTSSADLQEALLCREFEGMTPKKIIAMGNDTSEEFNKRTGMSCSVLRRPEFWTSFHAPAWQDYRETFRRMVQT